MQILQLAQFDEGRIRLLDVDIDQVPFIAVSHIWDSVRCRRIPSFQNEIYASEHKAEFIRDKIESLVGKTPFWLDTLCVNQRSVTAQKAVIKSIPAIYRQARKTIVVREGDGFQQCCVKAVGSFHDWRGEGEGRFVQHLEKKHPMRHAREAYLERLWTLSEVLLSDCLEFTTCTTRSEPRSNDPYIGWLSTARITDDMSVLQTSWSRRGATDIGFGDFIHAYATGGRIEREKSDWQMQNFEDYDSNSFFRNSCRSATYAVDYVLAIFPQFSWYSVPPDVETMTLQMLFQDCYQQALEAENGFNGRFTASLFDLSVPRDEAWNGDTLVPEPETLGDFLKLLGGRLRGRTMKRGWLARPLHASLPSLQLDLSGAVNCVVPNCKIFAPTWHESHIGGELSKYGSWPEMLTDDLDRVDANAAKSVAEFLQPIDETLARLDANWISQQVRIYLDATVQVFCGFYGGEGHEGIFSDWKYYTHSLVKSNSWAFKEQMLLMSAMIGCRIPLSSCDWIGQRFESILLEFPGQKVLGLISKLYCRGLEPMSRFARVETQIPKWPGILSFMALIPRRQLFLVVERGYNKDGVTGVNLVLVDPNDPKPVGLVPDFLYLARPDEDFTEKFNELYYQVKTVAENQVKVPLIDINNLGVNERGHIVDLSIAERGYRAVDQAERLQSERGAWWLEAEN